tara:strand:+ start:846 stop:1307 length:462 start_codon:yes stop_codon:yes gene_type:complete
MSNKFYIVPLFLTIFSIIVIGISLQLDTSPEMIVGDSMQARSFPIFLMVLKLVLLAVLTFQYKAKNPDPINLEKFPTWGSMGLFLIFYLLTVYTDMFIGIFVVMLLMGLLWGEKRIWLSFLTATLTPLLIFLLFDFVLKIRFPRGILMDFYYG